MKVIEEEKGAKRILHLFSSSMMFLAERIIIKYHKPAISEGRGDGSLVCSLAEMNERAEIRFLLDGSTIFFVILTRSSLEKGNALTPPSCRLPME